MRQKKRICRFSKRSISFIMSMLLVFSNVFGLLSPITALAASTADFNAESISHSSVDWTCSGTNYINDQIIMSGTAMVAVTEISLSGMASSVDVGTLAIDFSLDVDFNGEDPTAVTDAALVAIRFYDASHGLVGSQTLSSGTHGAPSTATLSSQATIPADTRTIEVTLNPNDTENIFSSIVFKNITLFIRDEANPTITSDYTAAWTNTVPQTITITAADTQSGVSAIYDAANGMELTTQTTYSYDVTENGTRQFYAVDYSGRSSDILTVEVTHIDTNAPLSAPEIILSESGWTNNDVRLTLGEVIPASGESPEMRQYQIESEGWQDYAGALTFDTDRDITVYARTVDAAGNVSAGQNSAMVRVDKTPPDVSLNMTPETSGGAVIETTISDTGSGILETKYAEGVQDAAYFASGGTVFTGANISVAVGGDYTVYALDAAGNETISTVSVNTYPVIGAIGDQTVEEDSEKTITFSVLDSETAAAELSISAAASGSVVDILDYSIDSGTGQASLTFVSYLNQYGDDSITVTLSDGDLSASETFNVTVTAVDDMPVIVDDTPAAIDEDSGYTEIDVLTNDSDAEGAVTIHSFDTESANGGSVRLNGTGDALEYRPAADFAGSDSYTYSIIDGTGNISNTATVDITVTNINDDPIAYNEVIYIDEDTETNFDVLYNDTDVDIDVAGDALHIDAITSIDSAAGEIEISGDQVLYHPTANYSGTFTFNYTVMDTAGGTDTATVTVVVEKVNDEPTFSGLSNSYAFDEDTASYSIDFAVSDVETAIKDLMVQASASDANVIRQTELAFINHTDSDPELSLVITPRENINGTCVITIQLGDGNVFVQQEVTLTINALNDAPVAEDDTFDYTEDQALIIDMDDALVNDTDVDGDALSLASVDAGGISAGQLQLVDAAANTYRFIPPENYNSTVTFNYTVADGNGGQAVGTVVLSGKGTNDPPVIQPDGGNVYETDEDIVSGDLIFNISDLETASDDLVVTFGSSNEDLVGKAGLSYTSSAGVVTLNILPNSNVPAAQASAQTTITLTVSDHKNSTDYSFLFTIYAVEDAPIAVADTVAVGYNSVAVISPLDNDYDNDLDEISLADYSYSGTGTVTQDGDTLTYTPASGFSGIDTINYTIEDTKGNPGIGTITLNVSPSSVAPEIEQIPHTKTDEDTPILDIPFTITDEDTDDGDLNVTVSSDNADLIEPANISVTRLGGGDYTIGLSPKENKFGTANITVSASDGLNSADMTFAFTVYPINDLPVANTDEVAATEDVNIVIEPIANDTDVENSTLSLVSFTQTQHGLLRASNGVLTYEPDENYYGPDTFNYEVTDGEATVTGTVNITVAFVNDNPVAWNDWQAVPAYTSGNSAVEINVISDDRDVDVYDGINHNNHLEVTSWTNPAYGTVALLPNGNLTYTRTQAGEGTRETDSFIYTITDPLGGTDTATVYIATEFGESLYTNSVSPNRVEDMGPYTIPLSVHIPSYVTNYTITTSGVDKGVVTAIDETNFILTYEPTTNENGLDAFSFTVINDDDPTETSTSYVYLYITPVNDAPYFLTTQPDVTIAEDATSETYTVTFTDDDLDITDDELTFWFYFDESGGAGSRILVQDDINMTRSGGTVTFSLTALENAFGTLPIAMKVSDNTETVSQNFTFNVLSENDSPYVPDIAKAVEEDSFAVITAVNSNSDIEDQDNVSVTTGPATKGTVTVNADKTITYTPNQNETGSDSFTYTLTDTDMASATGTVNITINPVNDAPNIYNYQYSTHGLEDTPLNITFDLSDVDNAYSELNLSVASSNSSILDATKITIPEAASSMQLSLTPEVNTNGTVYLTVNANDGDKSISREFELVFEPVNDYPVATDDSGVVGEDMSIDLDLAGDDTDIDDTELSVIDITDPLHGSVVILANGLVRYTPDTDYYGSDAFAYTVSDPLNGTDTANVTLTVTSINDNPKADDEEVNTDEDTPVTIDVLTGDTDVEGDTLFIDPAGFAGSTKSQLIEVVDGQVKYTPIENVYGDDTFTYTVRDGNGGWANGTVTVHIAPELDAPVAGYPQDGEPPWVMYEDQTVTFIVDYTSVEVDYPEIMMTATSTNTTVLPNTNIVVEKMPYGQMVTRVFITFTPEENQFSEEGFLINTTQKMGSETFNSSIMLHVLPRNDQPSISVTDIDMAEDTVGNGRATGNDVETATSSLRYRLSSDPAEQPSYGTVVVNAESGAYTYTPNVDSVETDTFYVVVDDGFTGGGALDDPATNKAMVTVTVTATNDPPDAVDDSAAVNEDDTVDIDVLDNDTDADIINEGDSLSIVSYTQPSHGTVAESGGQLTYTPEANYNGEDTFEYTIEDKEGQTDTADVTITINPLPDDPADGDDSYTVVEDSVDNVFDVLVNDDVDAVTNGEVLTLLQVLASDLPEHGTATVDTGTGEITYTPMPNYFGTDSFTYQMGDSRGTIGEFLVTVDVTAVNDAPVFETTITDQTMNEDGSLTIDFTVSDVEDDDDSLTVTAQSDKLWLVAESGLVMDNVNGDGTRTLHITPTPDKNGTTTITLRVTDSDANDPKYATLSFNVDIGAVNDESTPQDFTVSTDENTTLYIDVIPTSDVDLLNEGDTVSITSVDAVDSNLGTTSIGIDPFDGKTKVRFVPNSDWDSATDESFTFDYAVKDLEMATSVSATIHMTKIAVNDSPVITVNETDISTMEDTASLVYTFTVTDEETDDDALTVSGTSADTDIIKDDKIYVVNPPSSEATSEVRTYQVEPEPNKNENVNGVDVTLTVSDGEAEASHVVNVKIIPDNDGPGVGVDGDDTYTISEDSGDNILNVLINDDIDLIDSDPSETLEVTEIWSGPTHGTCTNNGTSITYRPDDDFFGQDSFVYFAKDQSDQVAQFNVTITVENVNDAPVITAGFGPIITIEEVDVLGSLFSVTDVDDDDLSLNVEVVSSTNTRVAPTDHFTINKPGPDDQDRSLDFYTNLLWNGTSTVTLRATDDEGYYDSGSEYTFNVIVSSVNNPPVAAPETVLVPEDHAGFTIDFIDENSDPDLATDPAEYVHYSSVTQPMCDGEVVGTLTIENGGESLLFVPIAHFNGIATFNYTLIDSGGEGDPLTDSDVCTVKVFSREDAPTTAGISASATEDTAYVQLDVLSVSGDVDMDADLNKYPTFDLSAQNIDIDTRAGAIDGVDAGSAAIYDIGVSGNPYYVIRYYPAANWNGVETFTYTIIDNTGNTVEGTAEVTITPEPDSPIAGDDALFMAEDELTMVLYVLNNDTDVDLDTDLNKHADMLSAPENLTIVSATQPECDGVAVGDIDVTHADKALTISNIPENWNGILTFDYVMTDRYGNQSTGDVTLTVSALNDNPIAHADAEQIAEDSDILIDVLANDTDVDTEEELNNISDIDPVTGANKEVLSLVAGSISAPLHGTAVIEGNGIRYTPASDYNGPDSFTYTMQDTSGVQRTATVSVDVTPVADNPTAMADTFAMLEDDLTADLDVLDNDIDMDLKTDLNMHEDMLDAPENLTIVSATQPECDSIAVGDIDVTNAGKMLTISNIPENWNGILTFEYEMTDRYGNQSTGAVTLTVEYRNDDPVGLDDTASVVEDSSVLIDVLDNDTDVDTEEELNNISEIDPVTGANKEVLSLVAGSISAPLHGTSVIEGNGIRYTPTSDYNGPDSFTYTMQDTSGVQRTATVSVDVTPVADNPTAMADTFAMLEDDLTADLDVLDNDIDMDLDTDLNKHANMLSAPENLTIVSATQPECDSVAVGDIDVTSAGKMLTISNIPENWNGILTFDYVMTDQYGNQSTGAVTLTVEYRNDDPVGVDDTASVAEDSSVLIDVLDNDTDVDTEEELNNISEIDPTTGANKEELILLDKFTGVSNAVVTVESNQVRFTPAANWNGTNIFTYTFRDHWGVEQTAQVTVDVSAEEDNPVLSPDTDSTSEDISVVIDLFANDYDNDYDTNLNHDDALGPLSADQYEELDLVSGGFGEITIVDGPAFPLEGGVEDLGSIQITGDGVITYTPPKDWVGRIKFSYTAEDTDGNQGQADVFIAIGAINDPPLPPTFVTPVNGEYYKDGQTVNVSWLAGSDADGDDLYYVVDFYDGTTWTNGVASFTPNLAFSHALGVTNANTQHAQFRARAYDGFAYSTYAYSNTFIIDNEAPQSIITSLKLASGGTYTPGTWTNESVYVSEGGGSDLLSIEYWMGVDQGAMTQYMAGEVLGLSATGECTVNFGTQDILQHYREVANLSVKIDKLYPFAPTVVFDHTDRKIGDVVVTFKDYTEDPGGSGNKWIVTPQGGKLLIEGGTEEPHYNIRRNGDYTFGIMDAAGNCTDFIVTVDWIIIPAPPQDRTSAYRSRDDEEDEEDEDDEDDEYDEYDEYDEDGSELEDGSASPDTLLSPGTAQQDGQTNNSQGGADSGINQGGMLRAGGGTSVFGYLGAIVAGGLGFLLLWMFALTNFTVRIAMMINGKIVKRSKRRWILSGPVGNKILQANFKVNKPHQMKIAGVLVKKQLAKKMSEGQVVITVNGKPLQKFDIPKEIDTKYDKTVRV